MPLIAYTRDVPLETNDPSDDQPDMKINTNSIDDILNVDHYSFGVSNGGLHKYVRMPVTTVPSVSASQGAVYTKSSTGSQLFYTPDNTTNEYQLTRCISAEFAEFGAATNGWTFLPGGLLLQYGSVSSPGGGPSSVSFPVTFTNPAYSVQLTARNDGSHSAFTYYLDGAPSTSGFTYRGSTTGSNTLFWVAIGN